MYKYRAYFSDRACTETTISTYSSATRILMINILSVWRRMSVVPSAYLFLSFYTAILVGNPYIYIYIYIHTHMCLHAWVWLCICITRIFADAFTSIVRCHSHAPTNQPLTYTFILPSPLLPETLQIIHQNPIKLIFPKVRQGAHDTRVSDYFPYYYVNAHKFSVGCLTKLSATQENYLRRRDIDDHIFR